MNLMYVDESGDPGYRDDGHPYVLGKGPSPYFVRVGVIVNEGHWHRIVRALRQFRLDHHIGRSDEIHATHIFRGDGAPWSSWHSTDRKAFLKDYLSFVAGRNDLTLVGVVIDKSKVHSGSQERVRNPKLRSLELLTERFNQVLLNRRDRLGLTILDSVEASDDQMHREFQSFLYAGSAHIQAQHFIESCLAEPSETSEFLQMADVCAHALIRHRCGVASDVPVVEPRFFRRGPTVVGLKVWPE